MELRWKLLHRLCAGPGPPFRTTVNFWKPLHRLCAGPGQPFRTTVSVCPLLTDTPKDNETPLRVATLTKGDSARLQRVPGSFFCMVRIFFLFPNYMLIEKIQTHSPPQRSHGAMMHLSLQSRLTLILGHFLSESIYVRLSRNIFC